MTQGSKMSSITQTTPAAIVAHAEIPTIVAAWRAMPSRTPFDHAVYALARQLHAAENSDEAVSREELVSRSLRKLIRTFGPVRNKNKLANGVKPFGALFTQLRFLKAGNQSMNLRGVLDEAEVSAIAKLAGEVFDEGRRRGNDELLKLAPEHVIRPKKPFQR